MITRNLKETSRITIQINKEENWRCDWQVHGPGFEKEKERTSTWEENRKERRLILSNEAKVIIFPSEIKETTSDLVRKDEE